MVNQSVFKDNQGSEIRFSKVNQVETKVHFKHFSIKHVLEGEEHYKVNQKKIHLKKGQFLVGNSCIDAEVLIDTHDATKGICIDVSKDLILDVIDCHFAKADHFTSFLFEHEVVIQKHLVSESHLSKTMQDLGGSFEQFLKNPYPLQPDVMMKIAEDIVHDHYQMFQSYQSLTFKKETTNTRIFDFIFDAKNYMDLHFLNDISVEKMAQEAKLSHYHFIRLFKKIFQITPYQYILEKRLELAKELLLKQNAIADVYCHTRFADNASFSKAFKAKFKEAPSSLLYKK